ncbi:hypothetical protein FJT64_020154 [Amphibalanus amphitrite]|uniref:Uncharacterized protein n=1 Tax=Amphibalanus amphitrite TaxID=1232801 RepID=A0A6A4X1E5_AMPAM|nr:hypothetical protein FJT64_020154 [Amphibalanus amphitrite]
MNLRLKSDSDTAVWTSTCRPPRYDSLTFPSSKEIPRMAAFRQRLRQLETKWKQTTCSIESSSTYFRITICASRYICVTKPNITVVFRRAVSFAKLIRFYIHVINNLWNFIINHNLNIIFNILLINFSFYSRLDSNYPRSNVISTFLFFSRLNSTFITNGVVANFLIYPGVNNNFPTHHVVVKFFIYCRIGSTFLTYDVNVNLSTCNPSSMFAAAEAEDYDYDYGQEQEGASDSGFFFPEDEDAGSLPEGPSGPQGPPVPQRPPLRDKPGPGTARNRATGSTSATSGGAADIRGSTTPGGAATTTTAASASCAVA